MKLKKSKIRHSKNQMLDKLKLTKPTVYDPEFKKTVVSFAEKKGNKEARRLYGVPEYNIRRWRGKTRLLAQKQDTNIVSNAEVKEIDALDSMPLEQRLKVPTTASVLTPPPEIPVPEQVLQSQPLSPTKLKVTRQVKPSAPSPIPPPPSMEEVCLKWNSHHSNMQNTFPNLLLREQYVDATLVAEGQTLKCHRVILSSCSPYFEDVLASISPYQHPVLFMKDVPFWILKCLCDFMYSGEVHILQTKLQELLSVAETLKIKGLAGQHNTKTIDTKPELTIPIKEEKVEEKEKEMKKKEEKEFRRKEEKEFKKKEEKEVKKKEEKELKKKDDKEIKKKEEKEIKKKEEIRLPEIKLPKKKEEKEPLKKEDKQSKKKEEIKENKEKKRVTITASPERSMVKSTKVPKVVIQSQVPMLKNFGVRPSRPRSIIETRKREKRLEREKSTLTDKISIPNDTPTTSSFSNPFDLLKPVYEEVTKDPKPSKVAVVKDNKNVNVKRTLQKKFKKRKLTDEREESPPPTLSRKGTRSRPRSKVAKYFHPTPVPSYDQSTIVIEPHTHQADSFLQIQDIKSEPLYDDSIEIEDNLVGFSECSVSVEEQLIDSFDSSFNNFGRRTTRSSKPIIMNVQSITNLANEEHTLKIVNLADLKANSDPLEDPLGLQSSSDSPSMVEQADNTLGFRISKVVTEKEDSQPSDVCTEMGFKIASIVSGQDGRKLAQTTSKIEDSYEEEQDFNEFDEDQKPMLHLIDNSNPLGSKPLIKKITEENPITEKIASCSQINKINIVSNEDDGIISYPANISFKIKEELITEKEQEDHEEEKNTMDEQIMFAIPNDVEMKQTDHFNTDEGSLIEEVHFKDDASTNEVSNQQPINENPLLLDETNLRTVQQFVSIPKCQTEDSRMEQDMEENCQMENNSEIIDHDMDETLDDKSNVDPTQNPHFDKVHAKGESDENNQDDTNTTCNLGSGVHFNEESQIQRGFKDQQTTETSDNFGSGVHFNEESQSQLSFKVQQSTDTSENVFKEDTTSNQQENFGSGVHFNEESQSQLSFKVQQSTDTSENVFKEDTTSNQQENFGSDVYLNEDLNKVDVSQSHLSFKNQQCTATSENVLKEDTTSNQQEYFDSGEYFNEESQSQLSFRDQQPIETSENALPEDARSDQQENFGLGEHFNEESQSQRSFKDQQPIETSENVLREDTTSNQQENFGLDEHFNEESQSQRSFNVQQPIETSENVLREDTTSNQQENFGLGEHFNEESQNQRSFNDQQCTETSQNALNGDKVCNQQENFGNEDSQSQPSFEDCIGTSENVLKEDTTCNQQENFGSGVHFNEESNKVEVFQSHLPLIDQHTSENFVKVDTPSIPDDKEGNSSNDQKHNKDKEESSLYNDTVPCDENQPIYNNFKDRIVQDSFEKNPGLEKDNSAGLHIQPINREKETVDQLRDNNLENTCLNVQVDFISNDIAILAQENQPMEIDNNEESVSQPLMDSGNSLSCSSKVNCDKNNDKVEVTNPFSINENIDIIDKETRLNKVTENAGVGNYEDYSDALLSERLQIGDYQLQTEELSNSNEPGFHIAQVVSEQIAEIEGSRIKEQCVVDTSSLIDRCEKRVSNSNELESIVNDLSRIVDESRQESSIVDTNDTTCSIADSLENLLQK